MERARDYIARLTREFPDDPLGRALADDAVFEDVPCPALDPETGACDLYAARPITCRTFGPPLRLDGNAIAVCELCFEGATPEQIAACEVAVDLDDTPDDANTIVAFALI